MSNWKETQPKSLFQVYVPYRLSDQEQQSLVLLYQPIIGAEAFSLYMTLFSEIGNDGLSETLFHTELITILNRSIKQIIDARKKLEGIGLLTCYVKREGEYGTKFIYRLNRPETIERFFKDQVLSLTLLTNVGQRKFDQLIERLSPKFHDFPGYEDISEDFKAVYSFKEEQVITEAVQLERIEQGFIDPRPTKKRSVISDSFDWSYFIQGIERFGLKLPEDTEGFKEEVFTFHHLFAINELDMVDFCSKAFDYYTNQIDLKELGKAIYHTFDSNKKPKQAETLRTNESQLTEEEQKTYRYNSLKLNGFSNRDIQVILDSEQNAPLNYLEALKNERGGYTTPQERSLIKYLVSKSGLPTSVINILINYVYNIQKQPTLKAEYVNRIANDWAQSNIFSPEKAMEHVRMIVKSGKEQQQVKPFSKNKQPIRHEELPEWMENPVAEEKLSKEEQAKLDQEIQDFFNKGGNS